MSLAICGYRGQPPLPWQLKRHDAGDAIRSQASEKEEVEQVDEDDEAAGKFHIYWWTKKKDKIHPTKKQIWHPNFCGKGWEVAFSWWGVLGLFVWEWICF